MKTFVLFGLLLIPLINGKYLLVQVDDNQPDNLEPTGKDNPMTRCAWPPCPDVEDDQMAIRGPSL